jgi:hypothetical protein
MEYNEIAAKRRKKLKSQCLYAPFAFLRGYSPVPFCSICCGLFSILGVGVTLAAAVAANSDLGGRGSPEER